MKKFLIVALIAAIAIPIFADDGTVLPAGVIRARVIPAYAWAPGQYDKDGKYAAFPTAPFPNNVPDGTVTAPNLGFSLEYGINDWITLGLQWAPGLTFSSSVPTPSAFGITGNVNGVSNLFAGVMVQIVGPKAPVANDVIRFDLAPGVKLPLGGVDLPSQTGTTITIQNPDKQTLGIGGRAYFDYVFSPSFFLNLYTQFIDYPNAEPKKYSGKPADVNYGYDLRVELDPHYGMDLADGLKLSANCAFRYDGTPDKKLGSTTVSDSASTYITANPAVALFFTKAFMPFELQLEYGQPLYGVNVYQQYSLDLQIKAFLKF